MSDKILLIPDCHNKWQTVRRIIENVDHSRIVQLGDWIDDFGDENHMDNVENTAILVSELAKQDNCTLIMGNHCGNYRAPHNKHTQCSGYTHTKQLIVNRHITPEIWAKFRWFTVEQGWVISHAGFHHYMVGEGYANDPIAFVAEMENTANAATEALEAGRFHPWMSVSYMRGGRNQIGGPLWQDWRESKWTLRPSHDSSGRAVVRPWIRQICGHTPHSEVRYAKDIANNVVAICADTHLRHYLTLEDGIVTVHETPSAWLRRP